MEPLVLLGGARLLTSRARGGERVVVGLEETKWQPFDRGSLPQGRAVRAGSIRIHSVEQEITEQTENRNGTKELLLVQECSLNG